MAEQKELVLSDLELAYINGQEHGGAPYIKVKDVRLTRPSELSCDRVVQTAQEHNRIIRSAGEEKACLEQIKNLHTLDMKLKLLQQKEREPWVKILSQIDQCIVIFENRCSNLSAELKRRIAAWREKVEEGKRKALADKERELIEYEQKARYDSDPVRARQAGVAAKQTKKEIESLQPKAEKGKGFDVVTGYDYEIYDRRLAAKLPDEAISMEIRVRWFDEKIKTAKLAGKPIPTFEGITVIPRTFVRIR